MNGLTGSDSLQLAYHFLKGCSFSLSFITKCLDEVSDFDCEVADHWLAEASKHVIKHLAREPRAEKWVQWQRNVESHQCVDGWVRTWRFRLGPEVLQVCAQVRRNQTLQVEVNEGLLNWQNTRGLKASEAKYVQGHLEFSHVDLLIEMNLVKNTLEAVVICHDGEAQQDFA